MNQKRSQGDTTARSVLIIDDEENIRDVLREILKRSGFTVEVAATGDEGVDYLRKKSFDVVVTDIIMPGKTGIDTIKEIRSQFPHTKIIAISGGGMFGPTAYRPAAIKTNAFLAAAIEAGADFAFTKPFSRQDLISRIHALISQ